MRKQSGFTLIELMVAVIIVGVLAAIAIPGYLNLQERAKASKALATLNDIRTALNVYRDRDANQVYTNNIATLQAVNPFPANDGDWAYTVALYNIGSEPRGYRITATRTEGTHATNTIVMDQTGTVTVPASGDNSWPP
ncbi:MAG: type II secretion system protein [Candidatus Omnitrophica bacterium]|jgi:type IV pilus assembly protein PilA|nr:type II secretion system protein [Candidatus Omnitrophota bacterium]